MAQNTEPGRRLRQFGPWAFPALMLVGFADLFLNLFRLPFTPIWMGYDQFGLILGSDRLWTSGNMQWGLFFPGVEMIHLLFFLLFGPRNWIPNLLAVLVGVLSMGLIVVISRKLMPASRFLTLLPAALFLFVFSAKMTGEVHRWLSSAAVLAALAVILEKRTDRRLAIAGVLCGLASFFTETQGVFAIAGLAVFLIWETAQTKSGWRKFSVNIAWLFGAFIVTLIATYGYFVLKSGLAAAFYSLVYDPVVIYPLDREHNSLHVYFTELPHFALHDLPVLARFLLVHSIVPFVYVISLLSWKRWSAVGEERARLLLINLVGLFLAAGVAPAPSYFRLCSVSAPALIVLVYWLRGTGKPQRIAVAMLWIAVFGTMVHHPLKVQLSPMNTVQLPRGPIAFTDEYADDFQLMRWLSSQTRPGQQFFAAVETGIFYPLALQPADEMVGGLDNTGDTTAKDVQDAISALEKHNVELIEWPPDSGSARFYRPEEDHLEPIRQYVQQHYHRVAAFGGDEIWRRN
jgi:Dolichyl-phosphate-mannose-protein mannosyltransferase